MSAKPANSRNRKNIAARKQASTPAKSKRRSRFAPVVTDLNSTNLEDWPTKDYPSDDYRLKYET